MKLGFKKLLVNILMLMVAMLPLRSGFAMSMDISPEHCAPNKVDIEMTMMNHAGHHMSAADQVDDSQQQKKSACVCCPQCDAQCTGCVHISAALTFGVLQLTDIRTIESVTVKTDSLLTRTVSPPSKPPLRL